MGGALVAKATELLLPVKVCADDLVFFGLLGGVVIGPSWALALRMLSRMYAEGRLLTFFNIPSELSAIIQP